eukprot:scaffold226408_cov30-Cyclotella_meneghiniana.AAC.1
MARGDILPPSERTEARDAHKNNTRRRNNQSESGRGNAGVEKDTNNTTISRNGGGEMGKNTTIVGQIRGRQGGNADTTTNRTHR